MKKDGKFVKVEELDDSVFYIYEHPAHVVYSNVTCTKLIELLGGNGINTQINILRRCADASCHASYLLYSYGDQQCTSILTSLRKEDIITEKQHKSLQYQLKTIQNEVATKLVSPHGFVNAVSYSEDDWTERLYHCLQFNNINSEFTARL